MKTTEQLKFRKGFAKKLAIFAGVGALLILAMPAIGKPIMVKIYDATHGVEWVEHR